LARGRPSAERTIGTFPSATPARPPMVFGIQPVRPIVGRHEQAAGNKPCGLEGLGPLSARRLKQGCCARTQHQDRTASHHDPCRVRRGKTGAGHQHRCRAKNANKVNELTHDTDLTRLGNGCEYSCGDGNWWSQGHWQSGDGRTRRCAGGAISIFQATNRHFAPSSCLEANSVHN
jgi:hypothetical protein